jgi:hypothetical protein
VCRCLLSLPHLVEEHRPMIVIMRTVGSPMQAHEQLGMDQVSIWLLLSRRKYSVWSWFWADIKWDSHISKSACRPLCFCSSSPSWSPLLSWLCMRLPPMLEFCPMQPVNRERNGLFRMDYPLALYWAIYWLRVSKETICRVATITILRPAWTTPLIPAPGMCIIVGRIWMR